MKTKTAIQAGPCMRRTVRSDHDNISNATTTLLLQSYSIKYSIPFLGFPTIIFNTFELKEIGNVIEEVYMYTMYIITGILYIYMINTNYDYWIKNTCVKSVLLEKRQ